MSHACGRKGSARLAEGVKGVELEMGLMGEWGEDQKEMNHECMYEIEK